MNGRVRLFVPGCQRHCPGFPPLPRGMEIQSPFRISLEAIAPNTTLTDWLLGKVGKYGKAIAMVDSENKAQWRFCDLAPSVATAVQTLKAAGLDKGNRMAYSHDNCPQIIILQLAAAQMGIPCTAIIPTGNVDELWHQVDLCEASHVFTQPQYTPKFEEVKKKATARGSLSKIRFIWLLDDYLSEPVQQKASVTGSAATVARLAEKGGAKAGSRRNLTASTTNLNNAATTTAAPPSRKLSAAVRTAAAKKPPDLKKAKTANQILSPASSVTEGLDETETEAAKVSASGGNFASSFILFFSSGTTGLPKPVEISHASFITHLQQLSAPYVRPPKANERVLNSVSLCHIYGVTMAHLALLNGASVITIPRASACPEAICAAVAEYKIQCMHVTPATVLALADDQLVEDFDLSSVQTLTCAGAPLDPLTAQQCAERVGLKDLRQLYGTTETLACSWSFFGCAKIDSIGVPLPGVVAKIVNAEKRFLLAAGELGELCVKGPQMGPASPRYYKNPKASNELLDKEGYVKTGDLAYYDAEGYIYIVDRLKDLIKHKGMQVAPTEVEILIRTHPGVADCAVIGRPEAISGDVPAAFIVKTPDMAHMQPSDVRDHVKGKIAGFKELKGGIFFVSEIPRTESGKVLRRQLKSFWERDRQAKKPGNGDAKKK